MSVNGLEKVIEWYTKKCLESGKSLKEIEESHLIKHLRNEISKLKADNGN